MVDNGGWRRQPPAMVMDFSEKPMVHRLFYSQFSLQFTGERLHLGAENRILSNKVSIVHDK